MLKSSFIGITSIPVGVLIADDFGKFTFIGCLRFHRHDYDTCLLIQVLINIGTATSSFQ